MTMEQLATNEPSGGEPVAPATAMRVRVVDADGHPTVNIRMPIRLVRWGMKMGRTFSPRMRDVDLDWDAISALVDDGMRGEIVHVEDEKDHSTVEVWVE